MNRYSLDRPRWCFGLAAVTALALGTELPLATAQTPGSSRPTVAVLPLLNNSGDASQDFFAGGMTDEIATALASMRGISVVARSSSFQLKPSNSDPKAIGQALNASHFVQGAARTVADRVHLEVRLLRADDGARLWGEEFDASLGDIFGLEESIARKIATAMKVPVGPGEVPVRSRTRDVAAYLDFLRAKVAARPRGAQALAAVAPILEQVVTREPDFAPAAALLAYGYALTPLFAPSLRGGMPEEERRIVERTIPRSDALARRATQLDPQNAEAFVALGYANMVQRKMLAAEDAFKQALVLNPNQADGLHGYSQFLAAMGRIMESLAMREHLQSLEQFIINYTADTAEIYWLDGDTEKAVAMLQPFRPARTLELALGAGRGRALLRVRCGDPRNAGSELSSRHDRSGRKNSRLRARKGRLARRPAAARQHELRLYARGRARARAGILRGRGSGRLFPADLRHLVLASDLCRGAQERAVQEGRERSRLRGLLARAWLASAVPSGRGKRLRLRLSLSIQSASAPARRE
jgi:TolB-like protein